MRTAEAKLWLAARPMARESHHYNSRNDVMVTQYVPRLRGQDVQVIGEPAYFDDRPTALRAARFFQDCIRHHHPEL